MFLTTCFAIQHLTGFRLLQPLAGLLCLRPRVSCADHTHPDTYPRSFLRPTCQRADARYCEQLQNVPQDCERWQLLGTLHRCGRYVRAVFEVEHWLGFFMQRLAGLLCLCWRL